MHPHRKRSPSRRQRQPLLPLQWLPRQRLLLPNQASSSRSSSAFLVVPLRLQRLRQRHPHQRLQQVPRAKKSAKAVAVNAVKVAATASVAKAAVAVVATAKPVTVRPVKAKKAAAHVTARSAANAVSVPHAANVHRVAKVRRAAKVSKPVVNARQAQKKAATVVVAASVANAVAETTDQRQKSPPPLRLVQSPLA